VQRRFESPWCSARGSCVGGRIGGRGRGSRRRGDVGGRGGGWSAERRAEGCVEGSYEAAPFGVAVEHVWLFVTERTRRVLIGEKMERKESLLWMDVEYATRKSMY